jgi:hypothetical protein
VSAGRDGRALLVDLAGASLRIGVGRRAGGAALHGEGAGSSPRGGRGGRGGEHAVLQEGAGWGREAGLTAFFLVDGWQNVRIWDKRWVFFRWWPQMRQMARTMRRWRGIGCRCGMGRIGFDRFENG